MIDVGVEMFRTVIIRDVVRGKELARFEPRLNAIFSLAIAPDRKSVAVCSGYDRMGSLWDISTGKELRRFGRGAGGALMASAFSPDGKWIAVGGEGGTVHVIEAATGDEVLPDQGHSGWIGAVAVAADGKTALTASGRDSTLRVYNITTGKELRQLTMEKKWNLSGAAAFAVAREMRWCFAGAAMAGAPSSARKRALQGSITRFFRGSNSKLARSAKSIYVASIRLQCCFGSSWPAASSSMCRKASIFPNATTAW